MNTACSSTLAILGGNPVRTKEWPKWPKVTSSIQEELFHALYSGRWAISGAYKGKKCFERRFADAFAFYNEAKFCTPTTSGTNALLLALLALGIGPGDEVLVPGLTWVACASVVVRLGAIPILIDIETDSLVMSLDLAKKAITSKTKAIMLVHLYGSVGDLDGFIELSEKTGIPIIEDCAQAHGTKWKGKCVGTFGKVGCFSMQQSKLLTSGEGGAIITNDPHLASKIEQLRSDGRSFTDKPEIGKLELIEIGEVQGYNMCLSEFQSAVLLGGLKTLDEENRIRQKQAKLLSQLLKKSGVDTLEFHPNISHPTYYNFAIKIDRKVFGNNSIDAICRVLTKEINANFNPIYKPLNSHPLYNPIHSPYGRMLNQELNPKRFFLPNSEMARDSFVTIHHSLLLDTDQGMHDISNAIIKTIAAKEEIRLIEQQTSNVAF